MAKAASWVKKVGCAKVMIFQQTRQIPAINKQYTVSQKNIPDIFDRNFKRNYQILIIFGTNIPDITFHQMTI